MSIIVDGKLIRRSFGPDRNAAEAVLAELLKRRSIAKATGESWTGLDDLKAKDRAKSKITFAEIAEDYFRREEITKEITADVVPITAALQKPDRVRRPHRSRNKPTVGFEPTTCGLRKDFGTKFAVGRGGISYR